MKENISKSQSELRLFVRMRTDAVPSLFAWTRTSPRKRKAPAFREIFEVNSPNVSMQSQDTLDEEPNDTCTLHTAEEGSAELDYGRKDVHTQTGPETEPENDRETIMQRIIEQKSELEKANRRIYSLQMQLFTPERFQEDDASRLDFILVFQTGVHSWLYLITWIQAWRVKT